MQDPRIRLASALLLSVSIFISLPAAGLAFAWWLVFTPAIHLISGIRAALPVLAASAVLGAGLELYGGDGLSYLVRMTMLVLIGVWFYREQEPGEFLMMSVWLFGDRWGFELGLMAEMGLQSLSDFSADLERIRVAGRIKGSRWGTASIIPAATVLVRGACTRAEDSAALLASRGYRHGGTVCPRFTTPPSRDILAGLLSACLLVSAVIGLVNFLYFPDEVLRGLL